MGVSPIIADWISHLHAQGLLAGGRVLDFGLSDVVVEKDIMLSDISSRIGCDKALKILDRMYKDGIADPYAIRPYFQSLGYDKYKAIDFLDSRDAIKIDLNFVPEFEKSDLGTFDLVTDFGTAEHLFNPGNSFISAHCFVRAGGVMLSQLPVFGHVNHGYYNIHPMLLIDIAKCNNYDVLDISYIDNATVRDVELKERKKTDETCRFDFGSLPISYNGSEELEVERNDRLQILLNFLNNGIAYFQEKTRSDSPDYMMNDAILTAFRKTSDAKFVIPYQS